jgi:hypothetical protein
MSQNEIEDVIDNLWDKYDIAKYQGNIRLANDIANRVLLILESIPKNEFNISTKH